MTGPDLVLSSPTPSHSQKASLQLLFFLRFIQLGSATITGFIYCYLVWHHNNHYCVYFPLECTAEEMSRIKVPWEYKVVLTACTLAFLESYISAAFSLHRQQMPNYRSLLCTITPVAALLGFACGAIFKNPKTSMYCWFNQIPRSLKADVEEKNCVIVVDGYVSLSIVLGFTGFIFLMSAIIVVSQLIRKKSTLPTEPSAAKPVEIRGEREVEDLITV